MIKFKSNPILFPTYESEVIVIVTDSLVEAAKELELPWEITDDDYIDAYCLPMKDKIYIVYKDKVIITVYGELSDSEAGKIIESME